MTRSLEQALIQASKRNRIVNPGLRISQEVGGALQDFMERSYAVDGVNRARGSTSAVATIQQVAVPTPGGSTHRLRVTVTTASNDSTYQTIVFPLEGLDVADLRFGTASAKSIVLRFGFKAPAGQYSMNIRNPDASRCYIASFTISAAEANTDVLRSFVVPGDTTGTWPAGNVHGMTALIAFGTGGGQGVPGWQSANLLTLPGATNLFATVGNVMEIFDVGLYEGTALPPFELPSYDEDLRKCQRYYLKVPLKGAITRDNQGNNTYCGNAVLCPAQMRASPTVTFTDLAGNASKLTVNGTHNLGISIGGVGAVGTDGQSLTVDAYLSAQAFGWYAAILSANARL